MYSMIIGLSLILGLSKVYSFRHSFQDLCHSEGEMSCGVSNPIKLLANAKCIKPFDVTQRVSNRIYGGKDTNENSWKWYVKIEMAKYWHKDFSFCGGTILNHNWIISAAHCFEYSGVPIRKEDYHKVKVLTLGIGARTFDIDKVVFVPGRIPNSPIGHGKLNWPKDVALIRTKAAMISPFINTLCVTRHPVWPGRFTDSKVKVVGLGSTAAAETRPILPKILQEIEFTPEKCVENCHGCFCYRTPGPWTYDSGSAVMAFCKGNDGFVRYFLAGTISSWSNGLILFLYSHQFMKWIQETTNLTLID